MSNRVAAIVQTCSGCVDPSSYNVQAIGQAKGMLALGWNVDFYANFRGISVPTVIHRIGDCVLRVIPVTGVQIFREIVYFPGLVNLLKNSEYSFVQVGEDTLLMTPLLLKALKRTGMTTVLIQGMYRQFKGYKKWLQMVFDLLFKDIIIQNADYVFAKTPMAQDYLQKKGYSDIKLFPIGLDTPAMNENSELLNLVISFKSNFDVLLLYVGKVEARRNPKFLLLVLLELRKSGTAAGLLVVGQGPLGSEFSNFIDELGLRESVLILDRVDNSETHILYQHADVFLLPTNYEIYGMVVMEALYWGCPVISTPEAGPLSILNRPNYGECVDLYVDRWVGAIHKIIKFDNNCLVKRNERSKYIKTHFNWVDLAEMYLNNLTSKNVYN